MQAEDFIKILGADFYTGVPDSQLKELCECLLCKYGTDPRRHIIAPNEGNCIALAAGHYLATGKVPVVYMQNSGLGNALNPIVSLLHSEIYSIPLIMIVGWRGEPGMPDEPQHVYQGIVTLKLLQDLDIRFFVIGRETEKEAVAGAINAFQKDLAVGKQVAFVIRKGAFSCEEYLESKSGYSMRREEVIQHLLKVSKGDPVISTTGKASRELFEVRVQNGQSHQSDFLTVGSMGHCSSLALGVALGKPGVKVWCIDGDGAVLMHMGAMALMGVCRPPNLIHIVVNNGAHESVGGMPTVAGKMDLAELARACGYPYAVSVYSLDALDEELRKAKARDALSLIEAKCAIGARGELGRPTCSPLENKQEFMEYLNGR